MGATPCAMAYTRSSPTRGTHHPESCIACLAEDNMYAAIYAMGCDTVVAERLVHFTRCPVVRAVANDKLSLGLSAHDPLRFLMLDGAERQASMWCRHAAYIHAVFATHNSCRHGRKPPCMKDKLWAEVRAVCMQHNSVRKLCSL